jgi:pyrroline-5-carboxylate reductase
MDSQTKETPYRLGFVGAGKLAGSVIRGLVRAKFCLPKEIIASEPNKTVRTAIQRDVGIALTAENAEVARTAEVILVGVKPGVVLPVIRELGTKLEDKLVISLAAGVRLEAMEPIANARFLRVLTNIPAAVCEAATGFARGNRTTQDDVEVVAEIFSSIGFVGEVIEEEMDAVTALAGSGPAFVYSVIESLAQGAEKAGLRPDMANTLAIQTVLGAAHLAMESSLSLADLIKMVVTPGGTTAAGLTAMEKLKTSEGLIVAIEAATKRGQEMAKETGDDKFGAEGA